MSKFALIPHGTEVDTEIVNAEVRQSPSGVDYIYIDFKIIDGEYKKRHIWQRFYLNASEHSNRISNQMFTQLLKSIWLEKHEFERPRKPSGPGDKVPMPDLIGYKTDLVVKVNQGTNGFKDTNEVLEFIID